MSDMVMILRSEYASLLMARDKLDALEAGGVDNWEGYDEAMRGFYGGEEDEDDVNNGMEDGSPFPGRDIVASEEEPTE